MSILDRILTETRDLVACRKKAVPLSVLEESPYFSGPTLSLEQALRAKDLSFIAEIKKASPSQGIIRADFDVQTIARQYKMNGAAAISVLTEPRFFKGSLDNLAIARQAVDLPLLRKDFILDEFQLYEARAYGADAVLLIAAALDGRQLFDLHQAASEMGLSCLVEIYRLEEMDKIDFNQVSILGVNNRDLHTFEVDINHSLRAFSCAPPDVVRVSESGLRTPEDLLHLYRNGVDAVLIGETFMRASDPGVSLRSMREAVVAPPPATASHLRRVV